MFSFTAELFVKGPKYLFLSFNNFLVTKTENVVKSLTSKMLKYSAEMEFEKAAEVRDTIESIKILNQKQIIYFYLLIIFL